MKFVSSDTYRLKGPAAKAWRAQMVAARIVLLVAGSYEWLARATPADLNVCSELYKLYAGQAYLALSSLLAFLFSLICRGIRNTVVTGRLNAVKGLKGTNQIIDFGRG
jgi:hypothetical protein